MVNSLNLDTDPRIIGTTDYAVYKNYDLSYLQNIWIPKLSIEGLIDISSNDVVKPVANFYMIYYPNDKEMHPKKVLIVYEFASHLKLSCPMDFGHFPFDTQECMFQLYSSLILDHTMKINSAYSATMKKSWNQTELEKRIQLQKFAVRTANISEIDKRIRAPVEGQGEVFYSAGGFKIFFERRAGPYKMKYYMPCAGCAVASWVSFLIPPEIVPGRAGLLVTLFLVSMTIFQSILENTPESGDLNGLCLFSIISNGFICAAILEYAILLYLRRNVSFRKITKEEVKDGKNNSLFENIDKFCFKLDRYSLFLFSFAYILFLTYTGINNSK